MSLKINKNIVSENIEDQNGTILGKIEFDPSDSRIMNKLSKILKYTTEKLHQVDKLDFKSLENIDVDKLQTSKEFLEFADKVSAVNEANDVEYECIENIIKELTEVFGQETMDIITGGSISLENIEPLINFIIPYVSEYRKKLSNKYLNNGNGNVL